MLLLLRLLILALGRLLLPALVADSPPETLRELMQALSDKCSVRSTTRSVWASTSKAAAAALQVLGALQLPAVN